MARPAVRPPALARGAGTRCHGSMPNAERTIRVLVAGADAALVADDPTLVAAIRAGSPATNVVVLATGVDRVRILAAIDSGAAGYLLADDDPAALPGAL